jgi:A/G-specific adenine glycosylase
MPWREAPFDPYRILVSEIMLQQTQVDRVLPKYQSFIEKFPSLKSLADASLGDVITAWSGLGYNRRAKYLHDIANSIAGRPFPRSVDELTKFKGIGQNTAAAILTYSFNTYHPFIETNVRTVYLQHFFGSKTDITDNEILTIVQKTADKENPREFFWALMDYGSFLKKSGVKNNPQSKGYSSQSTFQGSRRQLRGQVLRLAQKGTTAKTLASKLPDPRLQDVIESLRSEGLLALKEGRVELP